MMRARQQLAEATLRCQDWQWFSSDGTMKLQNEGRLIFVFLIKEIYETMVMDGFM